MYKYAVYSESQPLREAVSWNYSIQIWFVRSWTSASSWGCELKCIKTAKRKQLQFVSLFVRLWVEMPQTLHFFTALFVSLFVRLWVEMWNFSTDVEHIYRQPLREAVSWNFWVVPFISSFIVSLFVRLWVEIYISEEMQYSGKSASSWGCELKYGMRVCGLKRKGQPLREAVSWNVKNKVSVGESNRQPLREAVSWNKIFSIWRFIIPVSLFVRLWVEIIPVTITSSTSYVSLFVRLWVEILGE